MPKYRQPYGTEGGSAEDSTGYKPYVLVGKGYQYLSVSHSGRYGEFQSSGEYLDGGLVSGHWVNPDNPQEWKAAMDFPSDARYGHSGRLPYGDTHINVPSYGWCGTKLWAKSNPTRPDVDLANIVGELKDLPSLLRGIGQSFLRKGMAHSAGHLNLTYQFGWAPFARDVVSLFSVGDVMRKRFDALQRMRNRGNVKRKMDLFSDKDEQLYGPHTFYEWTGKWSLLQRCIREEKIWGEARWATNQNFPQTDPDLMALALRSSLGLSLRPSTAWNLMPWSWAIDWFANVGDYLEAFENRYYVDSIGGNLMHSTVESVSYEPTGPSDRGFVMSPFFKKRYYHSRGPAGLPSLEAHLPIFTMNQVGILASIGATWRRRGA